MKLIYGLFLAPLVTLAAQAEERVLFAFDDVSIPHTQNLRLDMATPRRHPANPVLERGAPGSPDAMGVQFYGSDVSAKTKRP